MKCPKCGHENKEGRKFCSKCGSKLENLCSKCGYKNDPEDAFCGECGAKLGESESPKQDSTPRLEDMHSQMKSLIPDELARKYISAEQQASGENRPITALFADISGFTPLSNTQSSETMFQLVQNCFRELVGIVARYEGSISGFRGDGLLALFGAPILHENDAERAILAAMDMRDSMQEQGLQISVGVNTAMMTVGEIQTQLHKEYTAYGTDINLAKRLQEAAEPGQIMIGTGTYRLTRRMFDFQELSSLSVKGFSQPITAYIVRQAKERPEKLRGIEGLRARMIGREHEFTDLKEAADAWLKGQGQIVSVIGEAGIGKSLLVRELREYLGNQGSEEARGRESRGGKETKGQGEGENISLFLLEGRCVSIGQPISYWPFLDILRTYFGLGEDDDEPTRARKVTESITHLMPQGADEALPLLGNLLSIKFSNELDDRLKFASPEQIRHQTLMRLRDLFRTLAEQQPLLLILEDLHWADDLSLDLVSLLMDELANTPLMLMCVYRPEKEHRVWQLGHQARRKCLDRYTELALQPLSSHESRLLVANLLTIDNLPESTKEAMLAKSEGNPFFIEEVIRSLIEQDMIYREGENWKARDETASVSVPDTIQSVVLARVDRLQSEAKYVLQCASVIGRLFRHNLLQHISRQEQDLDRYITEFEDKELIYEERTVPELEYAFKHAFTQEATYAGILEQRRREFHHQVAEGIERLYQEHLEEYYEELAHHYSRSEDAEKAVEYLLKAGEKAKKSFNNDMAIHYFRQALLLWNLPGSEENNKVKLDALRKLAEIYFTICRNNEAIEVATEALEFAERFASPREMAHLHYQICDALIIQHQYKTAIEWGERGLSVLEADHVCPEAALLNFVIGLAYWIEGDFETCREYFIENKNMIREIGYFDEIYKVYAGIRSTFDTSEERVAWTTEWIEVCTRHENQLGLAEGYVYLADDLSAINNLPKAIESCRKGLAIARNIGYSLFILFGHFLLGGLLLRAEEAMEAEKHLREAVKIMEDWGRQFEGKWRTVRAYRMLSSILIDQGDQEQAYKYLVKGLRFSALPDLGDFLRSLRDLCEAKGKLDDFASLCRSEIELRERDDEISMLREFLSGAQ